MSATTTATTTANNGNQVQNQEGKDEFVRPFEWLTSPKSLLPVIRSALCRDDDNKCFDVTNDDDKEGGCRILHVGSGSSVLGEYLLEHQDELFCDDNARFHSIAQLVNLDKDRDTLKRMEQRWRRNQWDCPALDKLEFCVADLADCRNSMNHNNSNGSDEGAIRTIPYPDERFDLVLDKSTLDCTLCSDTAAAWLLHEVFRLLKPHGGVYLLISFHPLEMLLPLIRDCPGTDWTVSHSVLTRQVEDLIRPKNNYKIYNTAQDDAPPTEDAESNNNNNNNIDEDDTRRTVHVLVARRRGPAVNRDQSSLNFDAIYQHIQDTNDAWFKTQHPILTQERQEEITLAFEGTNSLSLPQCYQVLFTLEERDQLTYEYFLEDWNAFIEEREQTNDESVALSKDSMTLDTALVFLNEMQ